MNRAIAFTKIPKSPIYNDCPHLEDRDIVHLWVEDNMNLIYRGCLKCWSIALKGWYSGTQLKYWEDFLDA